MKRFLHRVVALAFFAVIASMGSSASTLLCQTGPVTLTGSGSEVTLYSCAIPANAVPVSKSIRVTTLVSSPGAVLSIITLNGHDLADEEPPSGGSFWQFTLANNGGTTGSMAGLRPGSSTNTLGPLGFQSVSPAVLPWTTGWTLQIRVFADIGVQIEGCLFTVEILD